MKLRNNFAERVAWAPLPPSSEELTTLAFGSCADQQYPMPFWDTMTSFQPDVFVYGGDNVYGDCEGEPTRAHAGDREGVAAGASAGDAESASASAGGDAGGRV